MGPGQVRQMQVVGVAGIPPSATAVALSLTGVLPTTDTHLTVWPAGTPLPSVSNLNVERANIAPNLIVVKLSPTGQVEIRNNSGQIHVLADIAGYFSPGAGPRFRSFSPIRLDDTREGLGLPLQPQNNHYVLVGQPVVAVATNLTGTQPSEITHLSAFSASQQAPPISNLNLRLGQTVAVATMTPTNANGAFHVRNNSGTVHTIVDLTGWYA